MATLPDWVQDPYSQYAYEQGYEPGPGGTWVARGLGVSGHPAAYAVYQQLQKQKQDEWVALPNNDPVARAAFDKKWSAADAEFGKQFNVKLPTEGLVEKDDALWRANNAMNALKRMTTGAVPSTPYESLGRWGGINTATNEGLQNFGKYAQDLALGARFSDDAALKEFADKHLPELQRKATDYYNSDDAKAYRDFGAMDADQKKQYGSYQGLISNRMAQGVASQLPQISPAQQQQVSAGVSTLYGAKNDASNQPKTTIPEIKPPTLPKLAPNGGIVARSM